MAWKPSLEFESSPPRTSNTRVTRRHKVKTPANVKVKTIHHNENTTSSSYWVCPQFDDEMQSKARNERRVRPSRLCGKQQVLQPTTVLPSDRKKDVKSSTKQMKLQFAHQGFNSVPDGTVIERPLKHMTAPVDEQLHDISMRLDDMSLEPDFDPSLSSTPCHHVQRTDDTSKTSLHEDNTLSTILAPDTPYEYYECRAYCHIHNH